MKVSLKHFISCHNDVIISQYRRIYKTLLSNSFIDLEIRRIPDINIIFITVPGLGCKKTHIATHLQDRLLAGHPGLDLHCVSNYTILRMQLQKQEVFKTEWTDNGTHCIIFGSQLLYIQVSFCCHLLLGLRVKLL